MGGGGGGPVGTALRGAALQDRRALGPLAAPGRLTPHFAAPCTFARPCACPCPLQSLWNGLLGYFKESGCIVEGPLNNLKPSMVQLHKTRKVRWGEGAHVSTALWAPGKVGGKGRGCGLSCGQQVRRCRAAWLPGGSGLGNGSASQQGHEAGRHKASMWGGGGTST